METKNRPDMKIITLFLLPITCALVSYSIQKIIYISEKKKLFDEPTENRKIHLISTPNLGGVAIFATMVFISSLLLPSLHMEEIRYVCAGAILLFFLGLMDDLVGVDPTKKLMAQVIAALLLVIPGDLRITGLHGFLGMGEFPYALSVVASTLFILLVINALNLIDGINCLAGGIALLNCIAFATLFGSMHMDGCFFLCVGLAGCLLGFLLFNRTPARIFMGDTGSLFLGYMLAFFSIKFIEGNAVHQTRVIPGPTGAGSFTVVLSMLIIPVYDTLRVFILRIKARRSPFLADRNHIHHLLLDLGLSHMQATGVLLLVNIAAVLLAFSTSELPLSLQMVIVLSLILVLNRVLVRMVAKRRQMATAAREKIYSDVPGMMGTAAAAKVNAKQAVANKEVEIV
jgi:UDP-N-acetylmuramyl pentapeptide phosphotransferase/UDP-N-acetylglucosamine-1-phosphate transferase